MPHLTIDALGPLCIQLDGQTITAQAYDKVWALLLYLAHAPGRSSPRSQLAGLLWPDQTEERARTNLRQALSRLRKALDESSASVPYLLTTRTDVHFNADCDYTFDMAEFTTLLDACKVHTHRRAESCPVCAARRAEAVALYRGPFLDNFALADSDLFVEWAALVRVSLHQQVMEALTALVSYHEQRGHDAQALEYCDRQLELEPWREEAYRQSMRLLARSGQRSAALHRYEVCRTMLEAELGVEPAPETTAWYEQIRAVAGEGVVVANYLTPPTVVRHNLPFHPTPFLGREGELAALADLIVDPQCRLITVVGPGGIGKTRLALQAAREAGDAFAAGVCFVNLAPLNTVEFMVPTIATALDITLAGQTPPQEELLHYLRQQELLLLLDNFEHLLVPRASCAAPGDTDNHDNATQLLSAILRQARRVTLLVTSRERLNIQGEWLFDVEGLATPPPSWAVADAYNEAAETYSAVALFLQTARRVQPGFSPRAADYAAIAQICRLVQGMPLALELAAAWVRVLACHEIVAEIARSFGLLTTTLRDLPARHRSLQAVFDHSWQLLSEEEQRVLAHCSVFRGGFTREAAAAVADASLNNLAALVDKSMLRRNPNGRYEVHEFVRQYAAVRLVEGQREIPARNCHLMFFMRFAEEAEPQIRRGTQVVEWHEWVEHEHDNLRTALEWSLHGGEVEPGLRIIGALWEFWMNRGHAPEGQRQAERFLVHPHVKAYPILHAQALHTAGVCAYYQRRYQVARTRFAEAAAMAREVGSSGEYVLAMALVGQGYVLHHLQEFAPAQKSSLEALELGTALQVAWVKGDALNQLAMHARQRGDYPTAHQHYLECLASIKADGHRVMQGYVLTGLATLLYEQGNYAAAHTYLHQSLVIYEELGDNVRSSHLLTWLARLAVDQGNDSEAHSLLKRALALVSNTGHLFDRIDPLDALGRLAQRQGDYARARAWHVESLSLCIEMEDSVRIARTLEAFACLDARQGDAATAARLFGATERYHLASQIPGEIARHREYKHLVSSTHAQLGDSEFTKAWTTGEAMTLDEAIKLVDVQPQI